MRHLIFAGLGCVLLNTLVGCGQSGALMLPSDPNYDKRSQYILYKQNRDEHATTHADDAAHSTEQLQHTPSTDQK